MRVCLICNKPRKSLLPCISCNTGLYCNQCDDIQCVSCQAWDPGYHKCEKCNSTLQPGKYFSCETCSREEDGRFCGECVEKCGCGDDHYICISYKHTCKEDGCKNQVCSSGEIECFCGDKPRWCKEHKGRILKRLKTE